MKSGDVIGIAYGDEKRIDLCASVEKIVDGVIYFFVLNGCWNGKIDPAGTVYVFRGSPDGYLVCTVSDCRVAYCGRVPKGDYNEVIGFMNSQLERFRIALWFDGVRFAVDGQVKRLRSACSAFLKVWRGEKLVPIDDTIPF